MELDWVKEMEESIKPLSFVYMEKNKNYWHNNNSRDYHVKFSVDKNESGERIKGLPLGKMGDVLNEIILSETTHEHMTLMHRYNRCKDAINNRIDVFNREHMAYIFIWLRYSFIK